jgi:L-fuculose-phosphate aldolase
MSAAGPPQGARPRRGERREATHWGAQAGTEPELRDAVVATAREMNALGINRGKSGNVSARLIDAGFDGYLITPTGLPYATMRPAEVVAMPIDGDQGAARGERLPSSEWRFHRDIYRAPGDRGDRHGTRRSRHRSHARRSIPAFHYMIAAAGGSDIRCAPYATFGTQSLSDHAVAALEGRRACLLANHGMIAIGASLAVALALAVEVERPCRNVLARASARRAGGARPTPKWKPSSPNSGPTASRSAESVRRPARQP